MGDKITAKAEMLNKGVPCVPGYAKNLPNDERELLNIARMLVSSDAKQLGWRRKGNESC